jgi:AsmA protein
MAQGMKRLGTPIAALLGMALIGLIATSWLINRDALRQAVEAQIRAVTGLDLSTSRCFRQATSRFTTSG